MKKLLVLFFIFLNLFSYSEEDTEDSFGIEFKHSNIESFGESLPSLSLSYKADFSLIFTREWPEFDYQNPSNQFDIYIGNYYFIIGQGKYNEEILGMDYTFGTITAGLKLNNYDEERVMFYNLQKDFYLNNENILSGRVNIVDDDKISSNYMIKFKSNFWNYSQYFDFYDINKGIIEIDSNELVEKIKLKLAFAKDFESNENGFSFTIGAIF